MNNDLNYVALPEAILNVFYFAKEALTQKNANVLHTRISNLVAVKNAV